MNNRITVLLTFLLCVISSFTKAQINLGNDTTICSGSSLLLNAGSGYTNYKWNTGATTQSINVNTAALYYVEAKKGGIIYMDSILVAVAPLPVANAGADKMIRPGGSVVIGSTSIPGYVYQWVPATGLNNTNTAEPTASPAITTTYIVKTSTAIEYVQNGSFENGTAPNDFGQVANADFWYSANQATVDYFRTDGASKVSVPKNFFESNLPAHSGNAYGGFITYAQNPGYPGYTYREYPENKLMTTLKAAHSYTVSFYINKGSIAPYNYSSGKLGVYFSANKIDTSTNTSINFNNLPYKPVYVYNPVITDTSWLLISFNYVAKGTENYITIGNYNDNANTPVKDPSYTNTAYSYYVIDDVSITEKVNCENTDTVVVSVVPELLGNDTTICSTAAFTLSAGNGYVNYKWNTGATSQSINVNTTGKYWVTANQPGNSYSESDTILVTLRALPSVNIGNDTTLCNRAPLLLTAPNGFSHYTWSNGSTNPSTTVTAAGVYSVTVNDGFCVNADSVKVLYDNITLSLGGDIVLCGADSLILSSSSTYSSYTWSNGSTNPTITIGSTGQYSLKVSDNYCSVSDTISVTFRALPFVNIGNDTTLCPRSSLLLTAPNGFNHYTWSDGSTNPSITVTIGGVYSVIVNDGFCNNADSVKVLYDNISLNLGGDAVLCGIDSLTLSSSSTYSSYTWSNGSTNPSITIGSNGQYSLKVSDNYCFVSDTINVGFKPRPVVNLGVDTTFCDSTSLVLDAKNVGASYLWSTGAVSQTIVVDHKGAYSVQVNTNGCLGADTVIIHTYPLPVVSTISDTIIAQGAAVQLTARGANKYLWSPPDFLTCTSCMVTTSTPERNILYTVVGTDLNGCIARDSVLIQIDNLQVVFIPDAFSPNGDGENDMLFVRGKSIQSVNLLIYNRWGELMFQTKDINTGWDGKFNGEELNTAVFVYSLEVTFDNGSKVSKKGDISLFR